MTNLMRFDLEKSLNKQTSLDQFIVNGFSTHIEFGMVFTCFYNPVIQNKALSDLLDEMCVKVDCMQSQMLKSNFAKQARETGGSDCYAVTIALSHYVTVLTFLDFTKSSSSVQNFTLISNLIMWVKKFWTFHYPHTQLAHKDLEFFFAKYLARLADANYLQKITLGIANHRSVVYVMSHVAVFAPIETNPFTGVSFSAYRLDGFKLYGVHFSMTGNLLIKNSRTEKLLQFNDLSFAKLANCTTFSVSIDLFDKLLHFMSNKYSFGENLPASKSLSSKNVKLEDLFYFKSKILSACTDLYFMQSFDTRGRKYGVSPFSYTNLKSLRYVGMDRGTSYGKKQLEKSKAFNKMKTQFDKLGRYRNISDEVNNMLMHLFLILGKLSRPAGDGRVGLGMFITRGVELYENIENFKPHDVYDELEACVVSTIIKEVLERGTNVPNYLICKDATASGWQHLGMCLGTDATTSKGLNLDDAPLGRESVDYYWSDTYMLIIESFKKNVVRLPEKYLDYFDRKTLKPTIMTVNYGATFYKVLEDFQQITQNKDADLAKYFQLFYQFIRELPGFQNKISVLSDAIINETQLLFTDATVDFRLYKMKSSRHDFIVNGKRETIQFKYPDGEVDGKKTKTAAIANFIHASDSEVLRLMKCYRHSIHDCILIGIKDISQTLDEYEDAFNNSTASRYLHSSTKADSLFLLI